MESWKQRWKSLVQPFGKAKATAGALGIPLREFVTQAVEEKLSSNSRQQAKPWLDCAGELSHPHRETIRIRKRIEDEFEQIDPEDWK